MIHVRLLSLWITKLENVIFLILMDFLTEGFVIGFVLSTDSLHRGQFEVLDEVSDGLGQYVVTPDGSGEHLDQGESNKKDWNYPGENVAWYLDSTGLVEA